MAIVGEGGGLPRRSAQLQRVAAEVQAQRLDQQPLGAGFDAAGHAGLDALRARHGDAACALVGAARTAQSRRPC